MALSHAGRRQQEESHSPGDGALQHFINDLDDGVHGMLITFVDNTHLMYLEMGDPNAQL